MSNAPVHFDLSFLSPTTSATSLCPWDLPKAEGKKTDLRSAAPVFTPQRNCGELLEHRRYMEQFKVRRCERDCIGERCLNSHFGEPLRRQPIRLDGGFWNYTSSPCSSVQCGNPVCPSSHTYEERLYHPEIYKTTYCAYPLDDHQVCQGFGIHCPFAHSPGDLRVSAVSQPPENALIFHEEEVEETQEEEPQDCEREPDCSLASYKVIKCPVAGCTKKPCNFYHNPFDRRRDLTVFSYSSLPCKNVYESPKKRFSHPDRCKNGDNCKYAHTKFEAYYHPSFYKTQICSQFSTQGRCDRGESCAFLHPEPAESGEKQENEGPKSLLAHLLRANKNLGEEHCALKGELDLLKAEMGRLKRKVACPECRKNDKTVYLSCGHMLCQPCSLLLSRQSRQQCPVCVSEVVPLCSMKL